MIDKECTPHSCYAALGNTAPWANWGHCNPEGLVISAFGQFRMKTIRFFFINVLHKNDHCAKSLRRQSAKKNQIITLMQWRTMWYDNIGPGKKRWWLTPGKWAWGWVSIHLGGRPDQAGWAIRQSGWHPEIQLVQPRNGMAFTETEHTRVKVCWHLGVNDRPMLLACLDEVCAGIK